MTETPWVHWWARPRAAAVYDYDRVPSESNDRWRRVEPDPAAPLDLAGLLITAGSAVVLAVSGLGLFLGVDLPRVVWVMDISAGSLLAVSVVRRRLVRAGYLLPCRDMDRIVAHRAEVCFPDDIVGEEPDLAAAAAGIAEDDTTRQRRHLNQQAEITLDPHACADALRASQIEVAELSELTTPRANSIACNNSPAKPLQTWPSDGCTTNRPSTGSAISTPTPGTSPHAYPDRSAGQRPIGQSRSSLHPTATQPKPRPEP